MPYQTPSAVLARLQILSLQNVLVVAWVATATIVAIAVGKII